MNKGEILTPQGHAAEMQQLAQALQPKGPRVFDTCKSGIVLRTAALLEVGIAATALLQSESFSSWLYAFAATTLAALPAMLVWLMLVCALKDRLESSRTPWQLAILLTLGAVCGLYGGTVLVVLGLLRPWQIAAWVIFGILAALLMRIFLFWRHAAQQPAAVAAQLTELQARIRPHFLFNALNSAIALIRSDPRQAETVLLDLSELFRAALAKRDAVNTLEDELRLAQHYMDIEKIRFGERLRVVWQIGEGLERTLLPALILQPLLENAVKHGVEQSDAGTVVVLRVQRRGNRARISVRNNLQKTPTSRGNGLALKNVRTRLMLLYDVDCDFKVRVKDQVFEVYFSVPLADEQILDSYFEAFPDTGSMPIETVPASAYWGKKS